MCRAVPPASSADTSAVRGSYLASAPPCVTDRWDPKADTHYIVLWALVSFASRFCIKVRVLAGVTSGATAGQMPL